MGHFPIPSVVDLYKREKDEISEIIEIDLYNPAMVFGF